MSAINNALPLSGMQQTLSTQAMQVQANQEPFLETFPALMQDDIVTEGANALIMGKLGTSIKYHKLMARLGVIGLTKSGAFRAGLQARVRFKNAA